MDLASLPLTGLKGVGPKVAEKLERLTLTTIQDLLFHLPFRYQDRTRLTPLGAVRPGIEALVAGRIELSDVVYRGRRALVCRIADNTGHLHLRFFHFSAAQQRALERGRWLRCFGEVRFGPSGYEMAHPEYALYNEIEPPPIEDRLTPVYPATAGVYPAALRRLVQQALERYLNQLPEWLPPAVLAEIDLPQLPQALALVHRPPPNVDRALLAAGCHPAQQRLAFEELLAHILSLKRRRARVQAQPAAPLRGARLMQDLQARLRFTLTGAQQRVLHDVVADLAHDRPMQRLVQGDVGSGKTVVAACAAACAAEAGFQSAVMAPTELLAEQHLKNFTEWFAPLGVSVISLSGKLTGRGRTKAHEQIATGAAAIVVGTHALFQEGVEFARLGLIVVDEQHRFGVHQRLALRAKGAHAGRLPHQLIMTATPIPRTLAQSLYADLDVSVIDELPPGRVPVETAALPANRRPDVVARVRAACARGRQAYWVCPLIEESDTLALQTATDTAAALQEALPELRVTLVHGRMKPAQKQRAMAAFKRGEIHVLVATTVIEVGVDVPNASLMIIENAERLGLAQLHQLRGRVGRGADASSCVLLYHPPLAELARARLSCLRETNDGFEIARRDLEMRGPGEVLGTRQTGMQEFHIADIVRDRALLPAVTRAAELLLSNHPDRIEPLIRRWLGGREHYAGV